MEKRGIVLDLPTGFSRVLWRGLFRLLCHAGRASIEPDDQRCPGDRRSCLDLFTIAFNQPSLGGLSTHRIVETTDARPTMQRRSTRRRVQDDRASLGKRGYREIRLGAPLGV